MLLAASGTAPSKRIEQRLRQPRYPDVLRFSPIRDRYGSETRVGQYPQEDIGSHLLLRARYDHLRRDPSADVIPPVTDETVEALHALYQGNLRGLLKALDDGVSPSLGLLGVGAENASGQLTLEDIAPVLKQRYGAELDTMSVQTRVRQLRIWGRRGADTVMTQKDLSRLWGIKQPSVSAALQFLTDRGYVVALPREGGEEICYVLSGTSRLIFL